jgi:hypothetical protein
MHGSAWWAKRVLHVRTYRLCHTIEPIFSLRQQGLQLPSPITRPRQSSLHGQHWRYVTVLVLCSAEILVQSRNLAPTTLLECGVERISRDLQCPDRHELTRLTCFSPAVALSLLHLQTRKLLPTTYTTHIVADTGATAQDDLHEEAGYYLHKCRGMFDFDRMVVECC